MKDAQTRRRQETILKICYSLQSADLAKPTIAMFFTAKVDIANDPLGHEDALFLIHHPGQLATCTVNFGPQEY